MFGDLLSNNLFVCLAVVLKARHLTEEPTPWAVPLPGCSSACGREAAATASGTLVEVAVQTPSQAEPHQPPKRFNVEATHVLERRQSIGDVAVADIDGGGGSFKR